MPTPDQSTFLELAQEYNLIPVYTELLADTETPVSTLAKLGPDADAFLLESVEGGERIGRYSFIGHSPFFVLRSRGDRVWIERAGTTSQRRLGPGESPLTVLRELLAPFRQAELPDLPRFAGGAVGFVGYDAVRFFEDLPDAPPDDLGMPECLLAGVDELLIFDNVAHTMRIVANARVNGDPEEAYRDACERIARTESLLRGAAVAPRMLAVPPEARRRGRDLPDGVSTNFERAEFEAAVERIREYIAAGDIIQAVLSQRLSLPIDTHPFEIYRALRMVNPSPYMYYLALGGMHVVGSSPEILVTHDRGAVTVRPIAGTRPRGASPEEDEALERELLEDAKERAEHVMLVDLGRNDLGRVCEYGSVRVDRLMTIERYSHVMHIVSNVTGALSPGRDQFDVLQATFPAGTVSGAPKIRAMEILDEVEPTRRGPYAGAVGYFGFSGNMDTCIGIRTILVDRGVAHIQVGAGIVADSVPEREYEETLSKAAALFAAIELAKGATE